MKSIACRIVVITSLFLMAALDCVTGLRAETGEEKQASKIYRAPSTAPILSRVPITNNNSRFTQFTSIEMPGSRFTVASDINSRGQIVGVYADGSGDHGFLLDRGNFTTIDIPGASDTYISGINNSGVIIGAFQDTAGVHCFVLEGETVTLIQHPDQFEMALNGINDRGQMVGAYLGSDMVVHGLLIDQGVFTTIDVPGSTGTYAQRINNRGQIVGDWYDSAFLFHGFILEDGDFKIIDTPPKPPYTPQTSVKGVNSYGEIVGFVSGLGSGYLGFVEDRGAWTMFAFPPASDTRPVSVNDQRQIVGEYEEWTPSGEVHIHGFLLE